MPGEKNSSATLALLLKWSHSATLALLMGASLLSHLPSRGLYRMFIVPLALLQNDSAHGETMSHQREWPYLLHNNPYPVAYPLGAK